MNLVKTAVRPLKVPRKPFRQTRPGSGSLSQFSILSQLPDGTGTLLEMVKLQVSGCPPVRRARA
jgi:hypothetical protein